MREGAQVVFSIHRTSLPSGLLGNRLRNAVGMKQSFHPSYVTSGRCRKLGKSNSFVVWCWRRESTRCLREPLNA